MKKQLSLDNSLFKDTPKEFGGSLNKNSNPKVARPITTKKAMHVVMRSSLAKYEWSLIHYKRKKNIEAIIYKQAGVFNIKIYKLAICFNHVHMLIKLQTRESFTKFIKAISGIIAKLVLGVGKGNYKGLKFWEYRPYTKIVEWLKQYFNVKDYVILNKKEAEGCVPKRKKVLVT